MVPRNFRLTINFALCLAIVASVPVAASGGSDTDDDGSDADKVEFIDRSHVLWDHVDRWLVEYEAVPIEPTVGISVHKIMAAGSPNELYHMTSHFVRKQPWNADPFRQDFFIRDGKTCHLWPFNRIYSEGEQRRGEELGGTTAFDVLFQVLPKWPVTQYRSPSDPTSNVPIPALAFLKASNCRLLAQRETHLGEECIVFDNEGRNRLWLAHSKGPCVMRRDTQDPRSKRLLQRVIAEEIGEVSPNLWLPVVFRSQFFSAGDSSGEQKIERQYMIRLLHCAFNEQVPDSTFEPAFRPGTLKYESAIKYTQVLPDGEDLLSDIVDFMINYADLPTKKPQQVNKLWFLLQGLAAGVLLTVAVLSGGYWQFIAHLFRHQRRPQQTLASK